MATGVSWGSVISSGNNINYSITWEGFGCTTSREILFRLFDTNRNAIALSNLVTTGLNTTGTYSSSFINVYEGVFEVIALFKCGGVIISSYTSPQVVHGATIDPPTGVNEPDPITDDPDASESEGLCIPTTGKVSMGDLNVIFGRVFTTSNTLLSGPNNPSTVNSLFGISFLPNTGTISKSRPNAISELRGYCHVVPIIPADLSYSYSSNGPGVGALTILYVNTNSLNSSINITHSDQFNTQSNSGNITVKPGTIVEVSVNNTSQIILLTSLNISINGIGIYNQSSTVIQSYTVQFLVNQDDNISITAVTDGDIPFG